MAKLMSTMTIVLLVVAFSFMGLAGSADAYPRLQIDIEGGIYDTVTETVMATTNPFDLYAFAYTSNGLSATDIVDVVDTYYLSIALTPKTSASGGYGNFTIAGETVNVTSDMTYGNPPISAVQGSDFLPKHDIFDTFYFEYMVVFDAANQVDPYNTQDYFGGTSGGALNLSGSGMYYNSISIDMSNLSTSLGLHFDLYAKNADGTVDFFAPFSHDGGAPPVPEPTTFLLVGSGMAALGFYRRRQGRK